MWWAVDLLASEYGWAKTEILENVYIDELFFLMQKINIRKVGDYKMQLAIIQNPHVKNHTQLWKVLEQQEKELKHQPVKEEFDPKEFNRLKSALSNNPKFIVK